MPLTDVAIRKASPADKPYKLTDGQGLYLLVNTAGKYWRVNYRFAGKYKTLALGTYPDIGLADARERLKDARRLLANDTDPALVKKVQKATRKEASANSFEAVAREWYAKYSPAWATSHADRILRRLDVHVFPWMGSRPIAEINAPEVLAVLRRIEERGTLETAHRVSQVLGQVFRYAVATGRASRDPTGDLKGALPPSRPTHFAAVTEPLAIGALLRAIDAHNGGFVVKAALRLAPLVFVRPGELRTARWDDIDLDNATWAYTVSKTKTQHIVPLARQAVAILREIEPLTGHKAHVFPANRGEGRPMSENTVNAALRSLGYDGKTLTGHGFRAMARTLLDEVLSFPPHVIEQQLAHAVKDPLGRAYNRTAHLEQRRAMMQAWADYLDKLKAGAEIVKFPASA